MINFKAQLSIVIFAVCGLSACSSHSDLDTKNTQANVFELPHSSTLALQSDDSINTVEIEFLRVKHHPVECEGYEVGHCFLVQREASEDWVFFYDRIEGFDYQWGRNYEILVEVQEIDLGLADTSNLKYSLLEVVTETVHELNKPFNYSSRKPHESIIEVAPGVYSLLDGKKFTCTNGSCDALVSAIDQNQSVLLSFLHNANPDVPLLLDAVLCSDVRASFTQSCL